jgi:hypothetical protein
MKIEITFFAGFLLSSWLILACFLECLNAWRISKAKKEINLAKRKCEVCSSVYFVSIFFELWKCPLCGSINKEK